MGTPREVINTIFFQTHFIDFSLQCSEAELAGGGGSKPDTVKLAQDTGKAQVKGRLQ